MKQTFTRYVIQCKDGLFLSLGRDWNNPDFTKSLFAASQFITEGVAKNLARPYDGKIKRVKVTIEIE